MDDVLKIATIGRGLRRGKVGEIAHNRGIEDEDASVL
jgi:hypothetical protein